MRRQLVSVYGTLPLSVEVPNECINDDEYLFLVRIRQCFGYLLTTSNVGLSDSRSGFAVR